MSVVQRAKDLVNVYEALEDITPSVLTDLIEYIELVESQNYDLSLENDGLREELFSLEQSFHNYTEEEDAA